MPPCDTQKIQTDDKDTAAEATIASDSSIITQCFFKFKFQIFLHRIDAYVMIMIMICC